MGPNIDKHLLQSLSLSSLVLPLKWNLCDMPVCQSLRLEVFDLAPPPRRCQIPVQSLVAVTSWCIQTQQPISVQCMEPTILHSAF